MYQCPKCGRYLRFKIVYKCGSPFTGYDCVCGYDTFKEHKITATTSVTYSDIDYKGERFYETYSTKII